MMGYNKRFGERDAMGRDGQEPTHRKQTYRSEGDKAQKGGIRKERPREHSEKGEHSGKRDMGKGDSIWRNRECLPKGDALKMGSNASLLYDKYLEEVEGSGEKRNQRALMESVEKTLREAASVRDAALIYRKAYEWRKKVLPKVGCETQVFKVKGRIAVGLGSESAFEVGFRFLKPYGMPYIPGTALKGLAAHYCHCVWGEQDKRFRQEGEYYKFMFGSSEETRKKSDARKKSDEGEESCTKEAGHLVFYDAWIELPNVSGKEETGMDVKEKKSPVSLDVVCSHHQEYYTGSDKDNGRRPPADFDSPNPVHFLSASGRFLIGVSCRLSRDPSMPSEGAQKEAREWAKLGMSLLEDALSEWGIGAKTAVGYGRMEVAERV